MDPLHNRGQLLAVWDASLFIFGRESRCPGQTHNPVFYHSLNIDVLCNSLHWTGNPQMKITFALDTSHLLSQDEYPTDNTMSVIFSILSHILLAASIALDQICYGGDKCDWCNNLLHHAYPEIQFNLG
jgi:hypothetical protein